MKIAGTAFLAVVMISSLGLWGCSQQKNEAQQAKIRSLENRYTKLEEDYRLLAAANDTTRKKLGRIESERDQLVTQVEELRGIAQERDELRKKLQARTRERDAVQEQLVQFNQDLQNLATRVQTAANNNFGGGVLALPASRKSE